MLVALVAVTGGALARWLFGRGHGSDPSDASARGWRWAALLVAGALMTGLGSRAIGGVAGVTVLEAGYVLAAIFAVANWRRAGLLLIALGLAANATVIAVDDGMPVRGIAPGLPAAGHHHGLSRRDPLGALGDAMVLPVGHETISPGDVLVALGGSVLVFGWLEPLYRRRGAEARTTPVRE